MEESDSNFNDRTPVEPAEETTSLQKAYILLSVVLLVGALSGIICLIFRIDLATGMHEVEKHLRSDDAVVQELATRELVQILKSTTAESRRKRGIDDVRLSQKVLAALKNSTNANDAALGNLVLALGHMRYHEAIPAIAPLLRVTESGQDVRQHALLSLGMMNTTEVLPLMTDSLKSTTPRVRKAACLAIAIAGDKSMTQHLEPLLTDSEMDVKWSASLALAKLGSSAGQSNIRTMLDREFLATRADWPEQSLQDLMIECIEAVAELKVEGFSGELQKIAKSDPNLKVRSAAMSALSVMNDE
ncbi:MAG: HEAT repeat domain-containing protein [Planctomycetota bacterium]|nr:HEAT repeat domain-containing protein [Planctomycetota bacterium]